MRGSGDKSKNLKAIGRVAGSAVRKAQVIFARQNINRGNLIHSCYSSGLDQIMHGAYIARNTIKSYHLSCSGWFQIANIILLKKLSDGSLVKKLLFTDMQNVTPKHHSYISNMSAADKNIDGENTIRMIRATTGSYLKTIQVHL